MNKIYTPRNLVSCAIATALGAGPALTQADNILKIKLEDVGSTVGPPNAFSSALDGRSCAFAFNNINPRTYSGATLWTGDVGAGEMLWDGTANPTGSFSTGFTFGGPQFIPFTFGSNAVGEINILNSAGDAELSVAALDFGGNFNAGQNFLLPPDTPPGLQVNWLINNFDGTYKASFQWEHTITSEEDPSGAFVGFNARWLLEGTATLEDAPPTIQLIGPADIETAAGVPYNDPGADCLDTIEGVINGQLVTTTDPVTDLNNPQADFQMVYNCQDNAGLDAAEVRRNVTVSSGPDNTPPVVTLDPCTTEEGINCSEDGSSGTNTVDILVGKDYVDGGGTCFDNIDQDIPLTAPGANPNFTSTPYPADVDTSAPTTAEIDFSCTDTAGNSTQVTRTVNVLADADPPVINLNDQPQDVTLSVGATPPDLAFGITCTDTNPVDNPGGSGTPQDITANLDFDPTSVDTSAQGDTVVTYTCVDDAGNAAEPLVRTFSVVSGQAFEIISMTISDINADGLAGCFAFNAFNPDTCVGANRFSSDGSAVDPFAGTPNASIPGDGTDLDAEGNPIGVRFGVFQGLTEIARGFLYLNFPFEPFTFDPPTEDTTPPAGFVVVSGDVALIQLDSFPWGGTWTSTKPNEFILNPDPGTLDTSIVEIDPVDSGSDTRTFKYRMSWSHLITAAEDQTGGQFTNFNSRWQIEGVLTASATPTVLNDPPLITSMTASDPNFAITRIIVKNNGLVTANVVAEDPNGDNLSYLWTGPVTPIGGTTGPSLTFDPSDLPAGLLGLTVMVTDDAAEPLSTTGELQLSVVNAAPDPDYGDDDNDGIPNYLDAIDGTITPTRNLRQPEDLAAGEIVSDVGRIILGKTAFSTGRYSFIVTEQEVGVQDPINRPEDLGFTGGGIYDFKVADLPVGGTARIVLPQSKALPKIGEYHKFFAESNKWDVFQVTAGNQLASAMRNAEGECPDPDDDEAYDDDLGLVEGDDCIRLTLVDGSAMDSDGLRNGTICDPGTAVNNGPVPKGGGVTKFDSSSGGCTIGTHDTGPLQRSDWWLLGGFVAWLGWLRRKLSRAQH